MERVQTAKITETNQRGGMKMKIVAQFDLIWNQPYEKGIPATKIFNPDATLADVIDWVNSVTKDTGQYGQTRMSDIRLSITD